MKKVLFCLTAALLVMASTDAMAQEKKSDKLYWKGIETNSLGDNWEVKIGAGTSMLDVATKGGAHNPAGFFANNSWNINIAATKWFLPIVGARLQLDGGSFRNKSFDMDAYGSDAFKTPYVFLHGDLMLNLSNWIGGYREDRVYYAIPYAGFGYTALSWTKKSAGSYDGEFSVTGGLLNKFRVCKQIDIELDIRTWLFPENSVPAEIYGGGAYNFAFSASVGVAYRFNKRGWSASHPQSEVDGYLAEIERLKKALADQEKMTEDAQAEADKLAKEKEQLKKLYDAIVKELGDISIDNVAFFEIGKSTLSDYAKASLDKAAQNMINNNFKITIHGYADGETGSAKRNMELSGERTEAVKQYLIEKGAKESMITVENHGDTKIAFGAPHKAKINRCAVIVMSKDMSDKQ